VEIPHTTAEIAHYHQLKDHRSHRPHRLGKLPEFDKKDDKGVILINGRNK
jgi:hypothetical protein